MLASGVVAAISLVGCADGERFAPAAEPAESPPLRERPAGATFAVGREPEGLVVDGRTGLAAVITRDPSELRLVELDDRRVVARAPLPATGRHLALARPGGPVVVPIEQSDELIEVSLPGAEERAITVGDHPHDAAVAAGRTFVGNEFGDTVSVIEGDRPPATLDAPVQPGGLAASDRYLVVVAVAERVLAIYDARILKLVDELDAGEGPTHVVAADERAWVADTDGDAIIGYSIGPRSSQISRTAAPGSPYGIALDASRERLWVTLTASNDVVEYDVSGPRPVELARHPTLRQPNSVAVDPRTGSAVIAGRDAGRLELIEATKP